MNSLAGILHLANLVLFVALAGTGVYAFLTHRNPPSQLIALAVAIVGPLEDFLKKRVRRGKPSEDEPAVVVVDKATSAIFLALLLWVVFVAR